MLNSRPLFGKFRPLNKEQGGRIMIENILDRRANQYSVTNVTAIIEPAAADNSVAGATQFDPDDPAITTWYEERQKVSVKEAIAWGNAFEFAVTLVLLDYEDPMAIAEAMLGGGTDRWPPAFSA